jgi:hypothetical protein
MNRIASLRLIAVAQAGRPPALINKTNPILRHRHVLGNYFGGNCTMQPTMWLGGSAFQRNAAAKRNINRRSPDGPWSGQNVSETRRAMARRSAALDLGRGLIRPNLA